MSHRKDPAITRRTPTLRTSNAEQGKPAQPSSGRVAFDDRGNAVWEMRTADHSYVRDGSTTLVRKLVPPLSIEATGIVRPVMPVAHPQADLHGHKRAAPTEATNPYGTGHMGTVKTYPVRPTTAAKRTVPKPGVKPKARPGLLGRLFGRQP